MRPLHGSATLLAVALVFVLVVVPMASLAQPGCTFALGFKALRDEMPETVGDCIEDESFNLDNGNAEQRTTGGLLVWRKADNWTAFTDGTTTWISGPLGLAVRPNTGPLFPWEAPPLGVAPPAPAPPLPAPLPQPIAEPTLAPTPQPTAAPGEAWVGEIRYGYDPSGSGSVPSGGTLRVLEGYTLHYFFSWRNLTPGSRIDVQNSYARERPLRSQTTASSADGRATGVAISFPGLAGGGLRLPSGDVRTVISVDGREMARGYVLLE